MRRPAVTRQRRGPFIIERIDRSAGDVIVAIDGKPIGSASEFHSALEGKRPGDVVQLTILREGRTMTIPVTLGGDKAPAPRNDKGLPL